MAMSTSISALTTALGAYLRQFKPEIINQMLLGLFTGENNIGDRASIMDGITDQLPLPQMLVADIVKPANSTTFSATSNALVWDARILQVRRFKADLQIQPEEYEKSWLGYYKSPGSLTEKKMVLEEFIVQEILKRIQANVRQALYQGTYNSGGTAVNDIVSGFKTLLDAEVTATTITPTTLVAPTAANVITQIEDVFDDLGESYQHHPNLVCILPTAWYKAFIRANRADLKRSSDFKAGDVTLDGYSNCKVVHEPMLSGNRVIITPKDNMKVGVDTADEYNNIRFQEFERTIKMLVDGKIGCQVGEIRDTNRPLAYGKD